MREGSVADELRPTTGGKRSQSLAQRSRLNNITKTVRLTVDQRRERIQRTQEQNLLDGVDDDSISGALQDPLPPTLPVSPTTTSQQPTSRTSLSPRHDSANDQYQQQAGESATMNSAPPPYDFYDRDRKDTKSKSVPVSYDTKKPPEVVLTERDSSSRVLDPSESTDPKPKRSIWSMGFKKRSSTPKVEQVPRSSSDPRDNNLKDVAESSSTSQILNPFDDSNSQMQHTPAAIEPSKEEKEYFGLQEAMASMSMPMVTHTISGTLTPGRKDSRETQQEKSSSNLTGGVPSELYSHGPSLASPPVEKDTDSLHPTFSHITSPPPPQPTGYAALSLASERSRSRSEVNLTETTPSYYPPRPDPINSTNAPTSPPTNPYASLSSKPATFDRIRPSQRVREARERSRSREPPRDHTTRTTSPDQLYPQRPTSRLPSPSPASPPPSSQTWRTTPLPSSTSTTSSLATSTSTRLKITFSPTVYTSRISYSAARTLHLLDHAETNTIDGVPIALLTLIYPVSDGDSQTVLADEVELEVMHEGESRGLEIVFGAGQGHIAGVMEGSEGGCLWWSERGVPRGLRTVESLRLFRKFELVRW